MPSLATHERPSGVDDHGEDSGIRRLGSGMPAGTPERPSWPELVVMVRAQVRSLVGPTRDLEDLTQATLEQIIRALPRFEGRCELSTFTYTIASRIVMNHWRSIGRYLRRFVLGIDDVPEPEASAASDPESLADRERAARLHHHLDGLPAEQRMVVVLSDLEELPGSRIAEIVGCPEATVRSRLLRGRAALAKKLVRDPMFADDVRGVVS
ncbi:MAG TPA: RNA polymerase sigma factor [Labilithrix sp.]|nr:RNA polymerase sigma factor [Labilithrix sp.]